jgi:hypothetical protein
LDGALPYKKLFEGFSQEVSFLSKGWVSDRAIVM